MRNDCIFLETGIGRDGRPVPPHCAAGINFCWVGEERRLCRLCPLADREPTPVCDYAFIYTFLIVKDGQRSIRVEVECEVAQREADGVGPCLHCPAYATGGPVPLPEHAPLPVGPTLQPEDNLIPA